MKEESLFITINPLDATTILELETGALVFVGHCNVLLTVLDEDTVVRNVSVLTVSEYVELHCQHPHLVLGVPHPLQGHLLESPDVAAVTDPLLLLHLAVEAVDQ